MSLTQKLLQIDRGEFQKEEFLELKAKHLSKIMGEDVTLKFRALSGKEYTSLASALMGPKGTVDYSKAYDVSALVLCEALVEPSLKDSGLQKHFGVASPKDLAFLFSPEKNYPLFSDKVTAFSGFAEEDEVKEVKKLVESDGETNAMFWLFRLHHWKPSDFFELGYGEKQIVYAFLQLEIEQRKKEWQIEQ